MKFSDLGLAPEILRAVQDAGYLEPTPIQAQAIPAVLAGRDVMGGAQTGTGKTASFTLPLLHKLARHANTSPSPARHPVRALILTPTRELAIQVEESVKTYGKYLPLRSVCIYGGADMKSQTAALLEGREIVVATPGRLLDHVEQKSVNFNQVEFLVLDEADRMLDMGFIPDIRRILKLLPATRQSLLFSATFSDEIKKLADAMLKNPLLIEVARRNTVSETITHRVHPVAAEKKRYLLEHLLDTSSVSQALVFVGTKFGAARLASWLQRHHIAATAIHGDKSQPERLKALEAFKSGQARVLVATDVAARGLDIEDLPLVINFELPHVAEDYVHRIGRTGRAGKPGEAISLVAPEEMKRLEEIEKLIGFKIERSTVAGFEPSAASLPAGHEAPPRRGHGHRARKPRGPAAPIDHLPAPAAHLPHLSQQPMIAADGFDFSQPYTPKEPTAPSEADDKKSALAQRHPRKPLRPVAALLGGLSNKPETSS